jgi:hypothetical protein
MEILNYFRSPFPSRQGFSAYRFPGPAAHLPLFFIFALTGFLLCGPGLLLLIWLIAGLYIGRDVAVFSHYAPVLLLVIWAAMLGLSWGSRAVARFGRNHPETCLLLSAIVFLVQVGVAWRMTKTED